MRRAVVALIAVALLAPGAAFAQTPQTSLADIEDEVMCPICGVTLELATEAPQAIQQREFISGLVAEGLSKDEIKDRLVDEFGPEVLAVPDTEGFDLAAWIVPGLAIVVAGVGILFGLRRWRKAGRAGEEEGSGRKADAVSAEDSERLEEDLARYEL